MDEIRVRVKIEPEEYPINEVGNSIDRWTFWTMIAFIVVFVLV